MVKGDNSQDRWKVLVVGNNPIEMGHVFDRLQGIQGKVISTEMAFDLPSILQRLARFRPQHILIDDNVGRSALQVMVGMLQSRKTRNVPITILKSSNYEEAISAVKRWHYAPSNATRHHVYIDIDYQLTG